MRRIENPATAPVTWQALLGRLFEALDPKNLTKNQRFALACDLLAIVFFGVSLAARLAPWHYFVLALVVLGLLVWSCYTNLKS